MAASLRERHRRLTGIADAAGTTEYGYDVRGNLTTETRTLDGAAYVTGYAYDAAGHLTALTYPSGRVVNYDRDAAGNAAAEKLAEKLTVERIDCFRVLFPKGMDANEYALSVKPAAKSLGVALRSAEWLGKGQAPVNTTARMTDSGEPIDPQTGEILLAEGATQDPKPEPAAKAQDSAESPSLAADPPLEPTTATPLPLAPACDIEAEIAEHEVNFSFGDRRYRIRGLAKNTSYEQLKVNLLVRRGEAPEESGDDEMIQRYEFHLRKVDIMLEELEHFRALDVPHREVLEDPRGWARRVQSFLRLDLDVERMLGVVDKSLYRNRA